MLYKCFCLCQVCIDFRAPNRARIGVFGIYTFAITPPMSEHQGNIFYQRITREGATIQLLGGGGG